ncbi:hypothetical protein HPB52_004583 [Rhipicephalus sanguineus]|uniref:Uncharacterized protein n=1 Tax=Rhipicephalus sanguineus TaxID=34632 RepID=A0A9D4QC44_RHISA|nr:hypothetical protein HPB52_004583 [Rhipicephalus sanguineus]
MLWNLIASASAARLHHEQAQRFCKVVGEQPTALHLPAPAADTEAFARHLASSGAPCLTVSTAVSSDTLAPPQRALPGVLGTVGRPVPTPAVAADCVSSAAVASLPCTDVRDPRNMPLPVDSEHEPDDMDSTSTRKRSRPSESGSDDEGASHKMHAVETEHLKIISPTVLSSDAVAEEHSATHDADGTNETDFQPVLSKSRKCRYQLRASALLLAPLLRANQARAAEVMAAADTMGPSASSPSASGTVIFRPANVGASFHRIFRLAIAQALSALPGVKEVRVNTKKNIGTSWQRTHLQQNGWIASWPRRSSRKYP